MISSAFLVTRLAFAWYLVALVLVVAADWLWPALGNAALLIGSIMFVFAVVRGYSHVRRVRLAGSKLDSATLANRHRRQIELPVGAGEAFELVDGVIRELARGGTVETDRGGLRVRAALVGLGRPPKVSWRNNPLCWFVSLRNQVLAAVAPSDGSSSVTLICEPECGTWSDWFRVDDGANLENAKAIAHAITLRVAERRRGEQRAIAQTATEKELATARLSLLQAQVEPHFLYNTLASAQYLTRSDPAQAETMLGHLIQYLRRSLPRTDHALSTLGDELERSRAYLDILKLRMGERLQLRIDIPGDLLATPLPPMMLQTLVENAIKHGLEPKPEGGSVWIFARRDGARVAVTVADDGRGFDAQAGGGGIGLRNVRERLRLVYGEAATLTVAANFPVGVAATISVPAAHDRGPHDG
jgi:signal transduction histidine kinase